MNWGHKKFYNSGILACESLTLNFYRILQVLLLHMAKSSIDYKVVQKYLVTLFKLPLKFNGEENI